MALKGNNPFALLIFLFSVFAGPFVESLIVTVVGGNEKCYHVQAEVNQKIFASFEVISGGFLDIDATVFIFNGSSPMHLTFRLYYVSSFTIVLMGLF